MLAALLLLLVAADTTAKSTQQISSEEEAALCIRFRSIFDGFAVLQLCVWIFFVSRMFSLRRPSDDNFVHVAAAGFKGVCVTAHTHTSDFV